MKLPPETVPALPAGYSAEQVCERAARAFSDFAPYRMLCQAIAEAFYPERADFTGARSPGVEQYTDIVDGEPVLMRRDLANQLGAMLRRRGQNWFETKAFPRKLNKVDRVKKWCESATEVIRDVIYAPKALFTMTMSQSDNDYVAFGTSVVSHAYFHNESGHAEGIVFKCLHLRDTAWYVNGSGQIDEMYERMKITLDQAIESFGWEALSKAHKDKWQVNPKEEIEIIRCVMPVSKLRVEGKQYMPRARYGVMYVEPNTKHEFQAPERERPFFRTWPYVVRRWNVVSGERWGRSPCTAVALGDSRMMQVAGMAIIESLEKLVNPPLLVPDEGITEIAIRASGMTTFDPDMLEATKGRPPVTALEVGRPDYGMEYLAEKRLYLGRAFFQNLLKLPPIDGGKMTATEVNERIEEYVRAAAPIFEPMEAENGLLMDGVFERILDADGPANPWGGFEDGPDELQGAQVRFEFDTPLSIAYRKLRAEKARAVNAYMMERLQINPGIVDLVDHDEMDRDAIEGLGEVSWLLDRDVVEQGRQQKALAAAAADAANIALASNHVASGGKGQAPMVTPPHDPALAM